MKLELCQKSRKTHVMCFSLSLNFFAHKFAFVIFDINYYYDLHLLFSSLATIFFICFLNISVKVNQNLNYSCLVSLHATMDLKITDIIGIFRNCKTYFHVNFSKKLSHGETISFIIDINLLMQNSINSPHCFLQKN